MDPTITTGNHVWLTSWSHWIINLGELLLYPKIFPPTSQDISHVHTQGFHKGWLDKPSPKQSIKTRELPFSSQDGNPTFQVIIMPHYMLLRISMSSFEPYKSSLLKQLLRWLKISCMGQKVNCGQHTVKLHNFCST